MCSLTKATRIVVEEWSSIYNALDFCTVHFGESGTQPGRRWFYRIIRPKRTDILSRLGRRLRRHLGLKEDCYLYFIDPQDATLFCLMWPPQFDPK
jgi:hypothetical protein